MNPMYTILESPHRWSILAGIAFLAACFGAMFMLAFHWPHVLARIWLAVFLVATAWFLVRALVKWKQDLDASLKQS